MCLDHNATLPSLAWSKTCREHHGLKNDNSSAHAARNCNINSRPCMEMNTFSTPESTKPLWDERIDSQVKPRCYWGESSHLATFGSFPFYHSCILVDGLIMRCVCSHLEHGNLNQIDVVTGGKMCLPDRSIHAEVACLVSWRCQKNILSARGIFHFDTAYRSLGASADVEQAMPETWDDGIGGYADRCRLPHEVQKKEHNSAAKRRGDRCDRVIRRR